MTPRSPGRDRLARLGLPAIETRYAGPRAWPRWPKESAWDNFGFICFLRWHIQW